MEYFLLLICISSFVFVILGIVGLMLAFHTNETVASIAMIAAGTIALLLSADALGDLHRADMPPSFNTLAEEAKAKCEETLPRNKECRIVITATPEN